MIWLALVASSTMAEAFVEDAVAGRTEFEALAVVQARAERALAVGTAAEARAWTSRLRWRGAVPKVDVRFGTDADIDIRDASSASASSWTRTGQGTGFDVALSWRLGDLVFADLELRANRERIARAAAVRLALERVTQIYFQRLEIELAYRERPSARLRLEAARLDGLLDALTSSPGDER